MTVTEKQLYTKLRDRKTAIKNQIDLLKAERDAIMSQILDLQVEAHERDSKFKRGDVIGYQKQIGLGRTAKRQTRRALLLRYKYEWRESIEPFWCAVNKDMTLSASYSSYGLWISNQEMETAQKIGTWDFDTQKFVLL